MEVSGRKEFNEQTIHEEDQAEIYCQPCSGEGENIQVEGYCVTCTEFLCSSCLKVHRKLSATKNHVIKTEDEMPRVRVQTDPISELCDNHKTEIVKFYCLEHDEVGCGDCMVLGHKVCNLKLVPDVSCNYGNSEELIQIKKSIEQLEKEVASYQHRFDRKLKPADEIKVKVKHDIEQFRNEVNDYLDKAEAELMEKLALINDKDVNDHAELQNKFESVGKEINDIQRKLEQCSGKINQLFVTAKLARKKLKTCQESVENIGSKVKINIVKFEPSEEILNLKKNNLPLGKFSVQSQNFIKHSEKYTVDRRAKFKEKLNVQMESDARCSITGMVMISCDEIVMADCKNYALKIFNLKENTITSKYRPGCFAWDVTAVSSQTVAATLPDLGEIIFLNTKHGLSKSHCLKVKRWCYGIDHKNGVFAVTFLEGSIAILNLKGDTLHEINNKMFASLTYIAFSNDNKSIYASDILKHAVYELTLDGHLMATMKCDETRGARGLAVTKDGTIFVCSDGTSNKVCTLSPGTYEIRPLVVEHVERPFSILFCEELNKIFIGEYKDSSDSNNIKVFEWI